MKKILVAAAVIAIVTGLAISLLYRYEKTEDNAKSEPELVKSKEEVEIPVDIDDLSITVVYDNNPYKEGLETDWGFSCLIRGTEKTILFDTGGKGDLLLENMEKLGITTEEIDVVVISHHHYDHTGGLFNHILEQNSDVTVYLPSTFSDSFKNIVKEKGAPIVEVSDPIEICENVYSTGVMEGIEGSQGHYVVIHEQSLIINTEKGLIVVVGCSHPGVTRIVERAKELVQGNVLFVMGGFHTCPEGTVSQFKELGVIYVGPCHCSGDVVRVWFEQEYGEKYIEVGVGRIITLDDLS
jgi:7,8-dihydropterin-6-yl-methyl-4-(beta-D-ribofuranosyl)aminobenzene 5'-phosphate synthase